MALYVKWSELLGKLLHLLGAELAESLEYVYVGLYDVYAVHSQADCIRAVQRQAGIAQNGIANLETRLALRALAAQKARESAGE